MDLNERELRQLLLEGIAIDLAVALRAEVFAPRNVGEVVAGTDDREPTAHLLRRPRVDPLFGHLQVI